MATITAIRKIVAPMGDTSGWTYGNFGDGVLNFEVGDFSLRFKGDFTLIEFLTGTADTLKVFKNGELMFRIKDLSFGNVEWGQFESGLNTSIYDALATLLDQSDTVVGGALRDVIYTEGGADLVYGKDGNDEAYGGDGRDTMYGGKGRDTFDGDNGRDKIWGGKGNDVLDGDEGNDRLYGGAGNDYVEGDEDDDILFGGTGADTFNFDFGDGQNVVRDFGRGKDRLEFDYVFTVEGYDSRDFVDEYVRKANGNTYIEAENFSVELRDFTTTKSELALMIDLEPIIG